MSTYLADQCTAVRNWLAIGSDVYPDAVVTTWIRMAEEYLSNALRVKHMIQIDTSSVVAERVPLPSDWQEIRLVRTIPDMGVLRYTTVDDFYNPEWEDAPGTTTSYVKSVSTSYPGKVRRYCIVGNYIILGGTSSTPLQVELTYYQNIPPLVDSANNWINVFHPTVYMLKTLHVASMYAIEDDRGPMWSQAVIEMVNVMNRQHQIDKASGSVLMPVRKKTFG